MMLVASLAACVHMRYVVSTVTASRFSPGLISNGRTLQSAGKATWAGNR